MQFPEIIVSLTTFPARIGIVHRAIESVQNQIFKPSRIVLCLSRVEFPAGEESLPETLRAVLSQDVELLWVDANLKAHKKYLYAMQKYPDAVVITVDDDKIYPPTFISEMVSTYRKFPKCVTAMHVHLMTFDDSGRFRPYAQWKKNCRVFLDSPNLALFPVGAGGVLYPPSVLPPELFDTSGIIETCLDNDDIWLKAMELVSGVPVVTPPGGDKAVTIDGSQMVSLWNTNQANNDAMITRTFSYIRGLLDKSAEELVFQEQRIPDCNELRRLLDDDVLVSEECGRARVISREQKARADKIASEYIKLKEDLSAEMAKRKEDVARLNAENAATAAVADGQKTALAAEQAKVEALNLELETTRSELAAARREIESMTDALEMMRADGLRLRNEGETTNRRLAEADMKIKELEALLTAARADGVKKASEITSVLKKNADAVASLSKISAEFDAEKKKGAELAGKYEAQIKAFQKQLTESAVQKKKIERNLNQVQKALDKLSKAKLGRLTLKYWSWKDGIKAAKIGKRRGLFNKFFRFNASVSVIIPTYKANPYLERAVDSVLSQSISPKDIEILVCVNGSDKKYYKSLRAQYFKNHSVRVLYTKTQGLNAARNLGIRNASKDLFTFLDDDDMLSRGYLESLRHVFSDEDVFMTIGRIVNLNPETLIEDSDTYINRTLQKCGSIKTDKYNQIASLLSNLNGKIFRRKTFLSCGLYPLDEVEKRSEDVLFWAENYSRLKGTVFLDSWISSEAYIRCLAEGSLSRPGKETEYKFWITDAIRIIERLSLQIFEPLNTLIHKTFVLGKIQAQTKMMHQYFEGLAGEKHASALCQISASASRFLNKSLFADCTAIAFCHNFAPYADASAFVATKRLAEIDKMEKKPLEWNIIAQNMKNIRSSDFEYKRFYVDFHVANCSYVEGPFGFAPSGQLKYAEKALEMVQGIEADIIYSRSHFVGSHIAASLYKKKHQGCKWYAEFSDPLVYGVDNQLRSCSSSPTWGDVEQMVYEAADVIIFTNINQMEYMLSYNSNKNLNESIRRRSVIMPHPVLPKEYCHICNYAYNMDAKAINIGYFGTFYVTRKSDDLLKLLSNPKVVLHIFTTNPGELADLAKKYNGQIRVNSLISHLEFLNLASKMDYLVLTDTEFPGKINPFLPSKFSDYKATGVPILAKVQQGSVLSALYDKDLLKYNMFDEAVAKQLTKRRVAGPVC